MRRDSKLDEAGLWDYALRALGRRPHSLFELKQKLRQRAASSGDVDSVLLKLSEYKLINDEKYSENFASSKLSNAGLGRLRVLSQLRGKRVPAQIAELAVNKVFAESDETELIEKYLERRFRGKDLGSLFKDERALSNAFRRLRNAGFSPGKIIPVLKRYSSLPVEELESPSSESE